MNGQHLVYLALGANLGDRESNLVQALQQIRNWASIEKVSSYYETRPVGYLDQPNFLNLTCEVRTNLAPLDLLRAVKGIEKQMGRQVSFRNAPRPIDIDILLYDELVFDVPELTIPHPRMCERAFVLVPLAEIAPDKVHPVFHMTIAGLAQQVDQAGVAQLARQLRVRLGRDMQRTAPAVHVSLSRAGVTDLRRIIRISQSGQDNLFYAQIDLFADLDPEQMGVHMSRFGDVLEEAASELSLSAAPNIETLAARIAMEVLSRQEALRSEVNIRAVYPKEKFAPVSGKRMQELYTLMGIAVGTRHGCRQMVGVEVEGLTVCPCANEMVKDYSRERLLEEGFSASQIERVLQVLPVASHNQRGLGTLMIGSDSRIQADDLVSIIEASMSSETYDLLKRPDELFVVKKAHQNPRFVEDVVREMLQNVVDLYAELPDATFVLAKQINYESIHKHNAFAERYGTLGEIRREIANGEHLTRHTSMHEWLDVQPEG